MKGRGRAVFLGGVTVASPAERELAYQCGELLGKRGYVLLHGGYNGLMEDAARGASQHGAKILAVTMSQKEEWGDFNSYVTGALYAQDLGERLNLFLSGAGVVVAMGGGVGTLHEITAAIWYAGNVRRIPVILLGERAARLLDFLKDAEWIYEKPTRRVDFLHVARSAAALDALLNEAECNPRAPKDTELRKLGQRIVATAMVEEHYVRADGARLERYFSPFRLGADPKLIYRAAVAIATRVHGPVDIVAGIALGGVSLGTLIASVLGKPLMLVRRNPKPYGTFAQVEGLGRRGDHALMVDDVVRYGSAILSARCALESFGIIVDEAACLLTYGQSGYSRLLERGITLNSLVVLPEDGDPPLAKPSENR